MKALFTILTATLTSLSTFAQADVLLVGRYDDLSMRDLQAHLNMNSFSVALPETVKEGDKVIVSLKGFKRNSKSEVSEVMSVNCDFTFNEFNSPEFIRSVRLLLTPEKITVITPLNSTRLKTEHFIPEGYSIVNFTGNKLKDGSFCLASFPSDPANAQLGVEHQDRWITLAVSVISQK